jgi:hypothetical protein
MTDLIRRFAEWWAAHVPGAHKTTLYTKRKPLAWKGMVLNYPGGWKVTERELPAEFQPEPELYLERYYITPRWLSEQPFGVGVYLHRLHAPDKEGLHDHPWGFLAIVLTGGYEEETFHGSHAHLGRGLWRRLVLRSASAFHRISYVIPGTWTLLIHGPRRKPWGFLRPDAVRSYEVWAPR